MRNGSNLIQTLTTLLLFLLLEGISVLLITKNSIVQRYQIMNAVRDTQSFFWERGEDVRYFFNYKNENIRLAEENRLLHEQLDRYLTYEHYSDSTLNSLEPYYTYVPATIVKKSTNNQQNYLILNKGSENGIEEGMGVVTENGIVGTVSGVSKHYSYVISFLNTTQSVGAKAIRTASFGPISWSGIRTDEAILRDIPIHNEIAVGDTIVTSGFSAMYPADIPVGIVTQLTNSNGISNNVNVRLFEDYNSLHFVNIVVNHNMKEIKELEAND